MNRILLFLTTWLGIQGYLFAQGDLMIFPKRVVFEGNKQKEELNISNIGKDSAIYSISFVQYEMTEDGSFKQLDNNNTSNQWFAAPYLRVFPRKVALAPGESQTVRLQLRQNPNMVTSEYRSHLYFRSEKENNPMGMEGPNNNKTMSVILTPVFGISIPTIIRVGKMQMNASLSDLKLERGDDQSLLIKCTINRNGNCSLYGDLVVEYLSGNGKSIEVGAIRGIGVYTCIHKRYCTIRINDANDFDLTKGKIRVKLTSPKDAPYELYAEKSL